MQPRWSDIPDKERAEAQAALRHHNFKCRVAGVRGMTEREYLELYFGPDEEEERERADPRMEGRDPITGY